MAKSIFREIMGQSYRQSEKKERQREREREREINKKIWQKNEKLKKRKRYIERKKVEIDRQRKDKWRKMMFTDINLELLALSGIQMAFSNIQKYNKSSQIGTRLLKNGQVLEGHCQRSFHIIRILIQLQTDQN